MSKMTEYWILAAIILLLFLASLALWLMMRRNQRWAKSILTHLIFIAAVFGLILTIREAVYILLGHFKISVITSDMVDTTSIFAMAILAMLQSFQLINRLTYSHINRSNDPTTARLIARVLKLSIFLVLVLLFGEHFGIGLSGLMAFGGIGGIAIGVAGKDVLSNLFSGVMLFFDRPFSIGDWISSPDRQIEGTVKEIGWRQTKIMTFDHRPLYVPNSAFSTISVENPGRMTNRRINTTIGLRYEDAAKIADIVEDIRTMIKNDEKIDHRQTTLVFFNGFGDSALEIMIYCFTKTTVWADWLAAQQEIYLKIIDIVHARGADFAFPSETLYIQSNNNQTPETIQSAIR